MMYWSKILLSFALAIAAIFLTACEEQSNDVKSVPKEQFLSKNNQEVDFELFFDGTGLSYTVGDTVIQSLNVVDKKFDIDDITLSANSTNNSSVPLNTLISEDNLMSIKNLLTPEENIDFLEIIETKTVSWVEERPSNIELAYQVRVSSLPNTLVISNQNQLEIPEPQTISLLSIGAVTFFLGKLRRKNIA
ncbi:MAG: PEP-CTERM sorting domain-containing protein [Pleurocapsa sp.]